ncbi:MAG: phosphosulfolactate synthase [Chitinophagaceae bacterium]|nr:MAG: phosphosulfolactate synthase [Chitinophagaceae bacterium]
MGEILLKNIPERTAKPRSNGWTMVMDKGLSIPEIENFLSIAEPYTDIVKFGFGTAYVTQNLSEKIAVYKSCGIPVYFGGTLFEAFIARGQFKDYIEVVKKYKLEYVEVSDGSLEISHDKKCEYIKELSNYCTVLSEVGSKDAEKIIPPYIWLQLMEAELEAGAEKVIAEAREAGTVGIYRGTGEVRSGLVQEILSKIKSEKILWEAPQKDQQVWFIKLLGSNVNLGNIAPNDVLPLETLRLGLRGDTFEHFLGDEKPDKPYSFDKLR